MRRPGYEIDSIFFGNIQEFSASQPLQSILCIIGLRLQEVTQLQAAFSDTLSRAVSRTVSIYMNTKENTSTQVPVFELVKTWDSKNQVHLIPSNKTQLAPGAVDGLYLRGSRLFGEVDKDCQVDKVMSLLMEHLGGENELTVLAFDSLFPEDNLIAWIDKLVSAIARQKLKKSEVAKLSRLLLDKSTSRPTVKLAICLLGLTGTPADTNDLLQIGRYPEFSLYSSVAIGRLSRDPVADLMELADRTIDWGRVHAVKRLALYLERYPDGESARSARAWLLYKGWKVFMASETAHTCATAGDLVQALAEDEVEENMLDNACQIIRAMTSDSPCKTLLDWNDAPLATSRLLELLEKAPSNSLRIWSVSEISAWLATLHGSETLEDNQIHIDQIKDAGWTESLLDSLRIKTSRYLARKENKQIVRREFSRSDCGSTWYSWHSAKLLDIDLWDLAYRQLRKHPGEPTWYHYCIDSEDPARIDKTIDVFINTFAPVDLAGEGEVTESVNSKPQQILLTVAGAMLAHELYRESLVKACLGSRNQTLWAQAIAAISANLGHAISPEVIAGLRAIERDALRPRAREQYDELMARL
ncbi:MAG: hypothetical protein AB7W16_25095 [Candidatus Obscuribacterales bacterium]